MRHLSIVTICSAAAIALAACGSDTTSPPAVLEVALTPVGNGNGQAGTVGTQLVNNLRVLVTRNSLPLAGASVHWAAAIGNGVIAPGVGTTGDDGIALATWTLPTASGTLSGTASVDGAEGSPVLLTATALAGPATSFDLLAGNNQVVAAGATASEPLTVKLQDTYGNPVEGTTVTWTVFSGTATLSASSVNTGPGGTASVEVTAGAVPGAVVIRAIPGVALPGVDFDLTVTP
ncbi:MAG: Ig-like domain-containing protein [Gemmatimonadales bacterium]